MSEGIGAAVKRKEDKRFTTGKGKYTDDIRMENQAYAAFVRSPHAHCLLIRITADLLADQDVRTVEAAVRSDGFVTVDAVGRLLDDDAGVGSRTSPPDPTDQPGGRRKRHTRLGGCDVSDARHLCSDGKIWSRLFRSHYPRSQLTAQYLTDAKYALMLEVNAATDFLVRLRTLRDLIIDMLL